MQDKQDTFVSLTYQFIFSKQANIWNTIFDFEKDLNVFFMSNGLDAQVINTVRGSTGGRIIMVRKFEEMPTLKNMKGGPLKAKSQPSATDVQGLTNKMNDSFNAQHVKGK